MLNVPVIMLVAAAVVLAGVVYVATGRGGELAFFQADYSPLKLDQVTSTDVALFRPPAVLWGYSMHATDEALSRIAGAITERDIKISALQQQVADLEAAAARRGDAGPETSSRRGERPSLLRRARPGGRGVPFPAGRAERDAPSPAGRAERDAPSPAGRAERDAPFPADRAEREVPRDRDTGDPGRTAGQARQEPGDAGAPPTLPWRRRAPARDPSSAEWAALPKRPPGGGDGEDGR